MSYFENSQTYENQRDEYILIPHNASHYGRAEPENIVDKWNHFFLNGSNVEADIESRSNSSKSVINSCASSSCSSTSLAGSTGAERLSNTDNGSPLSPTGRDISLASDFPKRKSDGLCQITLSNKPSTLQHFLNGRQVNHPEPARLYNEMESSRLDDDPKETDHYDMTHSRKLNIEDVERMERVKISNNENGMLKSVKGTVRGYKNMVRRYSASFNSKGHVIPPPGQVNVTLNYTLRHRYVQHYSQNIFLFRFLGFKRHRCKQNYNLYNFNDSRTCYDRGMCLCEESFQE